MGLAGPQPTIRCDGRPAHSRAALRPLSRTPLYIMILIALRRKKQRRYGRGQKLRHNDRKPDSVDPQQLWQDKDNGSLKDQRTEKRDCGGNAPVVERGKNADAQTFALMKRNARQYTRKPRQVIANRSASKLAKPPPSARQAVRKPASGPPPPQPSKRGFFKTGFSVRRDPPPRNDSWPPARLGSNTP